MAGRDHTLAALGDLLKGVEFAGAKLFQWIRPVISEMAMRYASVACITVFVAACAASPEMDSPFYQTGFADGCASANGETATIPRVPQRDEALFAKDSGYRAGWISGHAECRMQGGPPRL